MKKIILAGHFAIGEKISEAQSKSIDYAKKTKGDLGILVNDIDLKRKIQFFKIGGKDMVVKYYGTRKKCGTALPLCELPEYNELPSIIDWDFYRRALMKIEKSKLDIDEILRNEIVPLAIKKRLKEYNLEGVPTKIFSERELRNIAGRRLARSKNHTRKSWVPIIEKTNIANNVVAITSKIPICGAISLALYEKISQFGYTSLIDLYAVEDEKAVKNGIELYKKLHEHFPDDKRWEMKITSKSF